MCGILGYIDKHSNKRKNLDTLNNLLLSLNHRGPDNSDYWFDEDDGIFLGHCRLTIIDLTDKGNQPMFSSSGRYAITYNGEIYNHNELRKEINTNCKEDIKWRGTSDTETILECISLWGLDKTLKKISGMFAFGLWDRKKKELFLARDKVGEKPLYYGWLKNTFVFGSELKVLQRHHNFNSQIDYKSVAKYFRYSYIPTPNTVYKNIYKLHPGSLLKINSRVQDNPIINDLRLPFVEKNFSISKWWSFEDVYRNRNLKKQISISDAINILEKKLDKSVKSQMLSDVPIGCFLSGGIDSSAIAALMQKNSIEPIKTFTVSFENKKYDESVYSKKISKYLKTDHHELVVQPKDILNLIPKLSEIYDEPFSDSSQVPTYFISNFASQHIKVALSGDGGDEIFGGYNRYIWSPKIWKWLRILPFSLRTIISKLLLVIPDYIYDYCEGPLNKYLLKNLSINNLREKSHKLSSKLNNSKNFNEFYISLISEWDNISELLQLKADVSIHDIYSSTPSNLIGYEEQMMYWDSISYLPDDILCKLDRASMNCSLETRVPFLDNEIINFSSELPLDMKINKGNSKWILKQVLKKHIPYDLIDRPKMGFSIPLFAWLKGPLKNWAYETLFDNKDITENIINIKIIKKEWNDFLLGKDNGNKLWSLITYLSWVKVNR